MYVCIYIYIYIYVYTCIPSRPTGLGASLLALGWALPAAARPQLHRAYVKKQLNKEQRQQQRMEPNDKL